MSEETSEDKEKPGLRVAQIVAAALAAVTAALLGSTIGVAGTVLGAGVASIITTVGGELYLRSLHRTRDAALKARDKIATSGPLLRRGNGPEELPIAEQPTKHLPRLSPADAETVRLPHLGKGPAKEPSRLRRLRWPLIIGTSVVGFAIAIIFIVGFEGATGAQIGGGTGAQIGHLVSGNRVIEQTPPQAPSTSTGDPAQSSTSPTTPSTTPSTSSPTSSSSSTTAPSTTTSQTSTTAPESTPTPSVSAPTTTSTRHSSPSFG